MRRDFKVNQIELAPYIFFKGNCREAMEFYRAVFGGELSLMKVSDVPAGVPGMEGSAPDSIMNAVLSGGAVTLRGADSQKASPQTKKVELCLSGKDESKMRQMFDGLAAGGQAKMPLSKMFWGDLFGQLTDKYGVEWMFNISAS